MFLMGFQMVTLSSVGRMFQTLSEIKTEMDMKDRKKTDSDKTKTQQ